MRRFGPVLPKTVFFGSVILKIYTTLISYKQIFLMSSTGNIVYSIYEDTSEVLWYGERLRLVRKDHLKKTEEHFVHDPNDPRSLNSTVVVSIYEDRKGVLWVGTNTGLNRFNKKDRSFTRFKSNLQINHSEHLPEYRGYI
jgi:ligand-binding sensor domain-containing protein